MEILQHFWGEAIFAQCRSMQENTMQVQIRITMWCLHVPTQYCLPRPTNSLSFVGNAFYPWMLCKTADISDFSNLFSLSWIVLGGRAPAHAHLRALSIVNYHQITYAVVACIMPSIVISCRPKHIQAPWFVLPKHCGCNLNLFCTICHPILLFRGVLLLEFRWIPGLYYYSAVCAY